MGTSDDELNDDEMKDGTGPAMGPLPAAPGCKCRICLPDDEYDAEERACIETVVRDGWRIVLVIAGDGPREPAFGYTVGLMHRLGHPELVLSGMLRPELIHPVLNHVAGRVMAGRSLAPGDYLEGALGRVPLLVEALNEAGLAETVSWSSWFHRGPVPALQLVWPDTSARFAWQPGSGAGLDERQPHEWRRPLVHTGAFAPDPTWPFPVAPDGEVVACLHVVDRGDAVCYVERRPGRTVAEEWYFHCGERHADEEYVLSHASHLFRATPSLREVGELTLGDGYLWREDPDHPWKRAT